jgi:CTP-dependent riboflavin kinase
MAVRAIVSIVPCKIVGRKAFIPRPDTDTRKHGHPPETILEIATDVNLRDTYKLKDGDIVEVEDASSILAGNGL